jgi:hypothetical protein
MLPREQLIASISSYLLNDLSGDPTYVDDAIRISRLLTSNEDDVASLTDLIVEEMQRQLDIRMLRTRARRGGATRLMGSQLKRVTRVHRVCRSIFGDPSTWKSSRFPPGKVRAPGYYWLHRDPHGVRVAGFDGLVIDVVVTGFVVKDNAREETKVLLLPFRARDAKSLMSALGVNEILRESPNAKIDWARMGLRLPRNKDLPWVYP